MSPSNLLKYNNLQEMLADFLILRYEYRDALEKLDKAKLKHVHPILENARNDLILLGSILERNGIDLDKL